METKKPQPTRHPTSAELKRVVAAAVKEAVTKELKPFKENLAYLMSQDHDQKVIEEWLKKHPQHKKKAEMNSQQWLNKELLKALIYALAIIGALVGAKVWSP